MAVPSRAFVGILVFGLICTFVVVPYTAMMLSGYQPPPQAPYEALFPEPEALEPGVALVLVLASLFSVALVVSAWRGLVRGARVDRDLRAGRPVRDTARSQPSPPETRPGPAVHSAASDASAGSPPPQRVVDEQPPGYQ